MITPPFNRLFEGVQVDMAAKYAALMKTMLLTAFYAPVAPVATVFAVVGLVMVYWSDKVRLFSDQLNIYQSKPSLVSFLEENGETKSNGKRVGK